MAKEKKGLTARLNNISIGGKLVGLFVILSAAIIVSMATVSFLSGSSAINKEAVNKLSAVAELKTQTIQTFFEDRFAEIHVMTGVNIIKQSADRLYNEIRNSEINANISLTEKRNYFEKNSANYRAIHQYLIKYQKTYDHLAEMKVVAIKDMKNIRGEIVFKEGDQIISTGDFKGNTKNRSMYKSCMELMNDRKGGVESEKYNCPFLYTSSIEYCSELKKGSIHMSHGLGKAGLSMNDLRKNMPVNERFSFMLIFDIDVNEINRICHDATGLGKSGETFLVDKYGEEDGADKVGKIFMLTDSRFEKSTALKRELTSVKELREHFKRGETRRGKEYCVNNIYLDHHGKPVLGHNHILDVGPHHIGVITEIDEGEVFASVDTLLLIMIGLGLIILVIAVIAGIFFSRSISKPMVYAVDFASTIATGDLTPEMEDQYLARGDEIGHLAQALKAMVDDLRSIISNVIQSAKNLNQAVQEIASGNETLSQRTSEQASALEEIASTIEESTASIKQNAENSNNASSLSRDSLTRAEDGGKIVDNSVNAIVEINTSSKKIGEIISVINEIAFQTNLLALNASVEAARAGEQGRGFAVVAGEVRNLAQRAGNAAKEIEDLIKDSMEKVELGTDLSKKSGEALREIIERIHTVNTTITEIAAASDEQKSGIEQINTAVVEMDSMTQQNASLVEETASASEEMANQAQELLAIVDRFKLGENAHLGVDVTAHKVIIHAEEEKKTPENPIREKKNQS